MSKPAAAARCVALLRRTRVVTCVHVGSRFMARGVCVLFAVGHGAGGDISGQLSCGQRLVIAFPADAASLPLGPAVAELQADPGVRPSSHG
jgi:hypothetical protein